MIVVTHEMGFAKELVTVLVFISKELSLKKELRNNL